ncbi:MAG: hypothetical protein SPL19_04440 [Fibrobacter sp.]|nr:hypothetical protein [Fibrobacter sp.]MDY6370116.1 hypothetical protein [Fibrobacter sp.]MDY6389589.1 hypothetical protein [Fibrobacter sp.]
MFQGCLGKWVFAAVFTVGLCLGLVGCGTSSGDSAGILIETNTGNKGLARVYVSTEVWDLSTGDTLRLALSTRDTVGDTVYVYECDYRKVVDSLSVLSGMLLLDSVPVGKYDSVTVYALDGDVRVYALVLDLEEGAVYVVDADGVQETDVCENTGWTEMSDWVYLSLSDFKIQKGDTLKLYGMQIWGVDEDGLEISHFEYTDWTNLVMDSAAVASGMAFLGAIPYGYYDSLLVLSTDGKVQKYALSFYIEKEKSYYIDSDGAKPVAVKMIPVYEGNAQFYFAVNSFDVSEGDTISMMRPEMKLDGETLYQTNYFVEHVISAEDISTGIVKVEGVPEGFYETISWGGTSIYGLWTLSETPVMLSRSGVSEVSQVSLALPEGFEDLASADESFAEMPFPVMISSAIKNPCLFDANANLIKLNAEESEYYADKILYWAVAPEVQFSAEGSVEFDVLENCVESNDLNLTIGNYSNHFTDAEISDSALALFKDKESLLGNSRWTDSTDTWLYINEFKPFSEDGYYMGLSIWFNIDSLQVGEYAQIVSAKKDSVGFTLQKRGTSGAANLRLDTKTGVYNSVYGRANGALDGTWHNFSFKIHGDSVTTFFDGKLTGAVQFDSGEGFSTAYNPGVGYGGLRGGIDELFFFDGTQSQNWMRLFYALQKSVVGTK